MMESLLEDLELGLESQLVEQVGEMPLLRWSSKIRSASRCQLVKS